MTTRTVRIGGASGFWGDSAIATPQLLAVPGLQYLVYDYLAETTMAILARARARDPALGWATDFVDSAMAPHLQAICAGGIRVVANAGGLNPEGCRIALMAAAARAGLAPRIAVVCGDDLMADYEALRAAGTQDLEGRPLPAEAVSANAYLGARGIARALDLGAQIVITGRCVDSAVVVGVLAHEYGWNWNDWDRLAAATLAGHVIECGAQATGGLFTDWQQVPDWAHVGYPVIDGAEDGSFVLSKPAGTGGLIHPGAVAEQVLYEIGDPAAYRMPDVSCDWRGVRIEVAGPDALRVSGARGHPPGPDYKVSGTWRDGWQIQLMMAIRGIEAPAKACKTAAALLERTREQLRAAGLADYSETAVELLGCESLYGAQARALPTREVVLRIAARHAEARALKFLQREAASPGTSMGPGTRSSFSGRAEIQSVVKLFSFMAPKSAVRERVDFEGVCESVAPPSSEAWRPGAPPPPIVEPPETEDGPWIERPSSIWPGRAAATRATTPTSASSRAGPNSCRCCAANFRRGGARPFRPSGRGRSRALRAARPGRLQFPAPPRARRRRRLQPALGPAGQGFRANPARPAPASAGALDPPHRRGRMPSILNGIKVLDLTRVIAGPMCTQILADMGATVYKIEKPGEGDDTRRMGPFLRDAATGGDSDDSSLYLAYNRGKQSITLDIASAEGAAIARDLASRCDVLVENYKAGSLARYGLDEASIRALRPDIVYCSITGFGPDGPYAARPAYDFILQGLAGAMSTCGDPAGAPMRTAIPITDVVTGLYASIAIVGALYHRRQTGQGQFIDAAMLDASVALNGHLAQGYLMNGRVPTRVGNTNPIAAPSEVFDCADGRLIVAAGNNGQFRALCRALGHPEWADDERFASNTARIRERATLRSLIGPLLAGRARAELLAGFEAAGVPSGPINDMAQVFGDEQTRLRELVLQLPHGRGVDVPSLRSPLRFRPRRCSTARRRCWASTRRRCSRPSWGSKASGCGTCAIAGSSAERVYGEQMRGLQIGRRHASEVTQIEV